MLYSHDYIITENASMFIHTNMKSVYDKCLDEKNTNYMITST